MTYYAVRDYSYLADDDHAIIARVDDDSGIPWLLGVPWPRTTPSLMQVYLSDEIGGDTLPDIFLTGRSLLSPKALAVVQGLGVDNLDFYDVVIHTRDGEQIHDYKAFYLIGALACMNAVASEYRVLRPGRTSVAELVIDEDQTMDMPMFRLAEDPLWLLLTERVKLAFEAAGVTGLYYTQLASS